jgi:CubicO group peptidase (beta-lactamase class C family)
MSAGGFSKVRLGRMHDVMAAPVERGEVPGLVTLISRRGEVHVDAIGTKAAGWDDPVGRDTIFRIASMTKPVTAAATMILVEEGRLRLDEPVDRLLPELSGRRVLKRLDGPLDETVPAHRSISVRDLLTFTMGSGLVMAPPGTSPIQDAIDDQGLGQGTPSPAGPPAPDEWIRRLGTLPLMHQPGEQWMYHTGSDVLGVLVARAAGQPFETFLHERLFEPLGMKDTAFHVPDTELDRFVPSYWTNFETGAVELYDDVDGQWSRPPAFPSGGAGLVSTVDDYLAFGQMNARPRPARRRAHPVPADGGDHDHRPADAGPEGGTRPRPGLLGPPRLGLRRLRGHPAGEPVGAGGPIRLGRRPGHLLGLGPL